MIKIFSILISGFFALLAGFIFISNPALADEDAAAATEDTAELCVNIRRIKRTDVVDERNILFYMNGGDIYVNTLPRNCNALRFNDGIMYKTSLSQLCNVDVITVLSRMGGMGSMGFSSLGSCGLGKFQPITKEEIIALKTKEPESDDEEETEEAE